MTYPNGVSLNYSYDSYGRASSIGSNIGGTWSTLADTFLYQPATDRLSAWKFGNGVPRMTVLDPDGRVVQLASGSVHNVNIGYSN
jgi:YD repeat-containing protein